MTEIMRKSLITISNENKHHKQHSFTDAFNIESRKKTSLCFPSLKKIYFLNTPFFKEQF